MGYFTPCVLCGLGRNNCLGPFLCMDRSFSAFFSIALDLITDISGLGVPCDYCTSFPLLDDQTMDLPRNLPNVYRNVWLGYLFQNSSIRVDSARPDEEAQDDGEDVRAANAEDIRDDLIPNRLVNEVGGRDEGEDEGDGK